MLCRKLGLGVLVLLLGSLETLHLLFQDFVDVGNSTSLVLELGGKGGKLVSKDGDLALTSLDLFVFTLQLFPELNQFALFTLNLAFSLFVCFLLALKSTKVLLMLVLLALEP